MIKRTRGVTAVLSLLCWIGAVGAVWSYGRSAIVAVVLIWFAHNTDSVITSDALRDFWLADIRALRDMISRGEL